MRSIRTDRGDAGKRLDHVLRRHLADVDLATRTRIQCWIAEGRVTVNGAAARRVAARLPAAASIVVDLPFVEPRAPVHAEHLDVDVLYEDEHLLAVNKPAGIVAHPTHAHTRGTLLNGLAGRAAGWPAQGRPSLVGRLDKLTSGVVLVAKTAAAHAALQRALRRGDKDYLAVVRGRVKEPGGRIDLPIGRDPKDRRRMVASPAAGAPSVTMFERLARVSLAGDHMALLRCRLVTGRTHQIRVHLAARGWPLAGDPVYGDPNRTPVDDPVVAEALTGLARQALHAWRVGFVHPFTGARVQVEAPIPDDLQRLLDVTGLGAACLATRNVPSLRSS